MSVGEHLESVATCGRALCSNGTPLFVHDKDRAFLLRMCGVASAYESFLVGYSSGACLVGRSGKCCEPAPEHGRLVLRARMLLKERFLKTQS